MLEISPIQRQNLEIIMDYLKRFEPNGLTFEMAHFAPGWSYNLGRGQLDCGSSGCVIGHAPHAGIPKLRKEDWITYSMRVFGIEAETPEQHWEWLFDDEWSEIDNTPDGAAARIRYLLANGEPPSIFQDELMEDWTEEEFADYLTEIAPYHPKGSAILGQSITSYNRGHEAPRI